MQWMLSSLWKVRPKSPKGKLMIKPEKQPRIKYHKPSKANDIWNLSAAYKILPFGNNIWETLLWVVSAPLSQSPLEQRKSLRALLQSS